MTGDVARATGRRQRTLALLREARTERDRAIRDAYTAGETLTAIAQAADLTVERVRQILGGS